MKKKKHKKLSSSDSKTSSKKHKTRDKTMSKKKKKAKKSKPKYQSGDLGRAIFALFDKYGIDNVTFEQALPVAKKAKPDTTYGKAYFSWHRNDYRNKKDL